MSEPPAQDQPLAANAGGSMALQYAVSERDAVQDARAALLFATHAGALYGFDDCNEAQYEFM